MKLVDTLLEHLPFICMVSFAVGTAVGWLGYHITMWSIIGK